MSAAPPVAMLAELTHRCPLACPYCSNSVALTRKERELDTAVWLDVFRQAADLGVLHVHLSGGEPLARRDLETLVAGAREAGLYANLITSGIGLTERRLKMLAEAGLDHVQLSLQGTDAAMADRIGGYAGGFARKMAAATWIGAAGLPLTLNFVLHRQNMHQLEAAIAMAETLGARRLEVATVQFHGWAMANRAALMPTREQARMAGETVRSLVARFGTNAEFGEWLNPDVLLEWARMAPRQPLSFELRQSSGAVLDVFAQEMPGSGFVMSFSDVTRERMAIHAMLRANVTPKARVVDRTKELPAALAEAERANATRSRFVAAASHDLLQPLSAAKLFVAAARDGCRDRALSRGARQGA